MARYMKLPQNQPVDMFSPLNIKFYSDLLDRAQSNLTQAAAMQAKFNEDNYGLKYIDKEARDKYVGQAENMVKGVLDEDFVSPARTVQTISRASQSLSPWKNVNEKQLTEAKRQQELQDRWGSNWIGNDITKTSLINKETGELIKPEQLNGIWGNREDLVQAILKDNAGLADKVREYPGGWYPILGGQAYESKVRKVKGLTEQERVNQFVKFVGDNPDLVKQYSQQMPGFAEAVRASGMNPEEYIANELNTVSKQFVRGEEYDRQHIANQNYKASGYTVDTDKYTPKSYTETETNPNEPSTFKTTTRSGSFIGSKSADHINKIKETFSYNSKKGDAPTFDGMKSNYLTQELIKKYPDLYEKARGFGSNDLTKVYYFLDLARMAEQGSINTNSKDDALFVSKRWNVNVSDTDNGMQRELISGNPNFEVENENGDKTTLGKLAEANALPSFSDNGDIVMSSVNGNYKWNTSDEKTLNSLNEQSRPIVQTQKYLFSQRWATVPDINPHPTGVTTTVPGTDQIGGVAFMIRPSGDKNANKIYQVYYSDINEDGSLDLFYDGSPDNIIMDEVPFSQVTKINSMALAKINTSEKSPTSKEAKKE